MAWLLRESFDRPAMDPRLGWFNPPPQWQVDAHRRLLEVRPSGGTDFWQQTHYDFRADNGHFLFLPVETDFAMITRVEFQPVHQDDQAGLMVRYGPECWMKTSVEHEPDGPAKLGVVVTQQGYSDWSTQDFVAPKRELSLRITRKGDDYAVEASVEATRWTQIRLTAS